MGDVTKTRMQLKRELLKTSMCCSLTLVDETTTRLEVIFTKEEFFAAVSNLNGDKTPGLDGFPLAF